LASMRYWKKGPRGVSDKYSHRVDVYIHWWCTVFVCVCWVKYTVL